MRAVVPIALGLVVGCTVDGAQLANFGQCPAGTKVSGVDMSTNDVLCSNDMDTLLEPGIGVSVTDGVISLDSSEFAVRQGVAPGYRFGLAVRSVDAETIEIAPGIARDALNNGNILVREAVRASLTDLATTDVGPETDRWYWIWILADTRELNPPTAFISSERKILPTANGRYNLARLIGAVLNRDGDFVAFRQLGQRQFRVVQSQVTVFDGSDPDDLDQRDFPGATPPGTTMATIAIRLPGSIINPLGTTLPERGLTIGRFGKTPVHPGPLVLNADPTERATLNIDAPVDDGTLTINLEIPLASEDNDDTFIAVTGYEWGSQEDFSAGQM